MTRVIGRIHGLTNVHPEAPVVAAILQLRREKGWGVRRIAHELNRLGVVNRAGGKLLPPAMQRIFNRHE